MSLTLVNIPFNRQSGHSLSIKGSSNTQRAVRDSNTQRAVRDNNTQRAVRDSNTQRAVWDSNTRRAVRDSNSQRAVRDSNSQRAVRDNTQRASILDARIVATPHTSFESLKAKLQRDWEAFPHELIRNACDAFVNRLKAVVVAKLGGKSLVIVEKPLFTPAIRSNRLERCQKLMNDLKFTLPGRVIIFSDEKTWTFDPDEYLFAAGHFYTYGRGIYELRSTIASKSSIDVQEAKDRSSLGGRQLVDRRHMTASSARPSAEDPLLDAVVGLSAYGASSAGEKGTGSGQNGEAFRDQEEEEEEKQEVLIAGARQGPEKKSKSSLISVGRGTAARTVPRNHGRSEVNTSATFLNAGEVKRSATSLISAGQAKSSAISVICAGDVKRSTNSTAFIFAGDGKSVPPGLHSASKDGVMQHKSSVGGGVVVGSSVECPRHSTVVSRNSEAFHLVSRNSEECPRHSSAVSRGSEAFHSIPRISEECPRHSNTLPRNSEDCPKHSSTMAPQLRSVLKRQGHRNKTHHRVSFNEACNQFMEPDYVILFQEEGGEPHLVSIRSLELGDLSPPSPAPPVHDALPLSPPDGYKDSFNRGLRHMLPDDTVFSVHALLSYERYSTWSDKLPGARKEASQFACFRDFNVYCVTINPTVFFPSLLSSPKHQSVYFPYFSLPISINLSISLTSLFPSASICLFPLLLSSPKHQSVYFPYFSLPLSINLSIFPHFSFPLSINLSIFPHFSLSQHINLPIFPHFSLSLSMNLSDLPLSLFPEHHIPLFPEHHIPLFLEHHIPLFPEHHIPLFPATSPPDLPSIVPSVSQRSSS
ncbi:hypothetical protein FHG87_002173 [Trinorchestia longiramus]|nr:hypothetical protein FHG87_002173 [Trinorchestia longiramus]